MAERVAAAMAAPQFVEKGVLEPMSAAVPALSSTEPRLELMAMLPAIREKNLQIQPAVAAVPSLQHLLPRYTQPFDKADKRPRIALVVTEAEDQTAAAIQLLPAAVTLALDPYARKLPQWIALARIRGHEVLLALSAPPSVEAGRDAAPSILASPDPRENLDRLDWALSRAAGYVGVLDLSDRSTEASGLPIRSALERRGLMLVTPGAVTDVGGLSLVSFDTVLGSPQPVGAIDKNLVQTEARARRDGTVFAIGVGTKDNLRRIASWSASLKRKGIALAPASAFIGTPLPTRQQQEARQ
jgi:uncharacterized protein